MTFVRPLQRLPPERFRTAPVLTALASANRQLAELKGMASSIPNEGILVSTLGLQEAKDSSAIENIVTTHDELFRDAAHEVSRLDAAASVQPCANSRSARSAEDMPSPSMSAPRGLVAGMAARLRKACVRVVRGAAGADAGQALTNGLKVSRPGAP